MVISTTFLHLVISKKFFPWSFQQLFFTWSFQQRFNFSSTGPFNNFSSPFKWLTYLPTILVYLRCILHSNPPCMYTCVARNLGFMEVCKFTQISIWVSNIITHWLEASRFLLLAVVFHNESPSELLLWCIVVFIKSLNFSSWTHLSKQRYTLLSWKNIFRNFILLLILFLLEV